MQYFSLIRNNIVILDRVTVQNASLEGRLVPSGKADIARAPN